MQFHSFQIDDQGSTIPGDCRLPDDDGRCSAVVLIPDILLSRRHGFYPFLATSLAATHLVVTYDASRSGYPADGGSHDEAVAGRYMLSSELADLLVLVGCLERGDLPCAGSWDGERLAIVGHGKGAALALHLDRRLRAEGLPAPAALALLAPPATLVREGWVGDGEEQDPAVWVPAGATEEVRLGADFLDDARALSEQSPLEELIATTPAPVLVVAGEEDVVFPPGEAERLLAAGNSPKDRLVVVEKAGHAFAAAHPFDGPSAALEYARDVVGRFFAEVLR